MTVPFDKQEGLDEGAWAYLSLNGIEALERFSHHRVIDACRQSGWPAVGWSPPLRHKPDSYEADRFFEGMEHAVRYSDVVVAVLCGSSEMTERELELALGYGRPIVALLLGERQTDSTICARLRDYDRGQSFDCADLDDCIDCLCKGLTDPTFLATIHSAAIGSPAHA